MAGKAQLDVEINPINIAFGKLNVSAEKGLAESFGLELMGSYDWKWITEDYTSFSASAWGKYYMAPDKGLDHSYIGPYLRYSLITYTGMDEKLNYNRVSAGFGLGYKWVSERNIVFDLGIGAGRAFVNQVDTGDGNSEDLSDAPLLNIDVIVKFAVGYRF